MSVEMIARRYASALADVVLASGDAEPVKTELAAFADLFKANADLANVFANPSISHSGKVKVLDEIIARTKPSRVTSNFLKVLLQNGRLAEVAAVSERFGTVLEERGGVIAAEVVSARELGEADRAEFEQSLAKLSGKRVRVAFSVDKEIIGGSITRVGSNIYDNSVRTKLDNLRQELISG